MTTRCPETHNPGMWPYTTRCVKATDHNGNHLDRHGNQWKSDEA